MHVSSIGFNYVGPKEPGEPVGAAVQLNEGLIAQDYEDGTLIEISARIGDPVINHSLPEGGVWSQAFESDGFLYMTIWYPKDICDLN